MQFSECTVARWAVYDIPLSAVQVAALSAEMAEYNEIETPSETETPPSSPIEFDFDSSVMLSVAGTIVTALMSIFVVTWGFSMGFVIISKLIGARWGG